MKPALKPNYNRASIVLYCAVALNAKSKSGRTINKIKAAQTLSALLQIDQRAPISWLRGDFKTHPLSRENFTKFVRAYRAKPGLESAREINSLAVDLYGRDYKKALELLDPIDHKTTPESEWRCEEKELANAIFEIINSSSPEAVKGALMHLLNQHIDRDFGRGRK